MSLFKLSIQNCNLENQLHTMQNYGQFGFPKNRNLTNFWFSHKSKVQSTFTRENVQATHKQLTVLLQFDSEKNREKLFSL